MENQSASSQSSILIFTLTCLLLGIVIGGGITYVYLDYRNTQKIDQRIEAMQTTLKRDKELIDLHSRIDAALRGLLANADEYIKILKLSPDNKLSGKDTRIQASRENFSQARSEYMKHEERLAELENRKAREIEIILDAE